MLVAVLFSFNDGRSRTDVAGLLVPVVLGRSDASVWHDAACTRRCCRRCKLGVITTLITVPLGVLFALGIDRWRGRLPSGANFLMLLSFVLPEVLLAVSLLFVITTVALPIELGTTAQVIGLVTFQVSYPGGAGARPAGHHRAANTRKPQWISGASPLGRCAGCIMPMLMPAIFASTVLVFADVIDDFVHGALPVRRRSTEPVSVKIYNTARAAPTPALNALATLLLLAALAAVTIGYLVYRRMTRGDDTTADRGIGAFAGEIVSPRSAVDRDQRPGLD